MLIKKIGLYDRFDELKSQVLGLCDTVMEHNHISLQYDKQSGDMSWLNAWGADKTSRERYFDTIQPKLTGTEIHRLFDTIKIPLVRTRIFAINPITVGYTPHYDTTYRIHIPIVTDLENNFYSYEPDERVCDFMPADGSIYLVDTRKVHTFKNLSNIKRIHIVGCYYGDDTWK
jgi:hypothetical protein